MEPIPAEAVKPCKSVSSPNQKYIHTFPHPYQFQLALPHYQ